MTQKIPKTPFAKKLVLWRPAWSNRPTSSWWLVAFHEFGVFGLLLCAKQDHCFLIQLLAGSFHRGTIWRALFGLFVHFFFHRLQVVELDFEDGLLLLGRKRQFLGQFVDHLFHLLGTWGLGWPGVIHVLTDSKIGKRQKANEEQAEFHTDLVHGMLI